MKTAEEILRMFIPPPRNEGEKNDDINIIKAMEEYARQFAPDASYRLAFLELFDMVHNGCSLENKIRANELYTSLEKTEGEK